MTTVKSKTFVCMGNLAAVDFINSLLKIRLDWVYIWNGGSEVRLTVDAHRTEAPLRSFATAP